MENSNHFYFLKIVTLVFLFLSVNANANWIKSENKNSTPLTTQNTPRSDSLPEGVTRDWLNSLRDTDGNRINPDEGDALQQKTFTGLNPNDHSGASVAPAGDVNGDGYTDIIIGAFGYANGTGRAYLFYGGQSMHTVPDVIMTGDSVLTGFGSVASAGDVNGDGFSDVIVGAALSSLSAGKAFIYFGGTSMNNIPDVILTGESFLNYFGASVSTAGDVNHDGYSDVIVGARGFSSNTGKAYIFFGGISMNNTPDITMTGTPDSYFGSWVSVAGDVNADGYNDLLISAVGYSSFRGRAFIYFGGPVQDTVADVTMTGEANVNYFGVSAATAGDVNGDGYSDVIIGAYAFMNFKGRAYVFYGGSPPHDVPDVIFNAEANGDWFGLSVSTAGDINGDGFSDVIVGAEKYASQTGRAYVYFGGVFMDAIADITITGETSVSWLGCSVSTAGDVNGDGYPEILVGAEAYSNYRGRTYLYDYNLKNEIVPDLTMTGESAGNTFANSVSSAGDVNGDGYKDVIVGAPFYFSQTGRAYVFFGGASMDNVADLTVTGDTALGLFGYSVASAGDVNGDGYSDFVAGAPGYSSNRGRAFIYFGGVSPDTVPDVIINGQIPNGVFGYSVSSAGDINGDAYSDVIIGAQGNSSSSGKAYVFFGNASMNNTPDMTISGSTTGSNFGKSVSSAGDVNNDGYSDVIVGAPVYSSSTGRAFVYFGGSSPDTIPDMIMTGEASNNNFGISVSSAGDVNRDGYSDIIVGASGYSNSAGRSYIYFGGAIKDTTADVIMTGESSDTYFGNSVSSAGDVNADGFSDVIVGAYGYLTGTGRSYLFLGSSSFDNAADVTMKGGNTNSQFGFSVSSAGDLNGDGYSDMIAGANAFSSNQGRSFIYLGSAISAKPILISVKDIPNDQGGYVNIKWARSSLDVINIAQVTSYSVLRSYPPSGGNFAWQEVATITARQLSFYSYIDHTPFDSSSNSSVNLFYRIRANTSNPSVYWYSAILSGKSIDNLVPPLVYPFTASVEGTGVRLNWGANTAPDLLNYILYRSYSSSIDPFTEAPLATVTGLTYLDTSPLTGNYYYFIVAQDIHGNYSPVAVAQSPGITLNLSVYLQGFYIPLLNTQVSDTIRVYLRNSTSPYAPADSSKHVLSSDGFAVIKFGNASDGNYYIEITHRNSIQTWSAAGISMTRGSTVNYNFGSDSSAAYGNNMPLIDNAPFRYGLYAGDVNQDGIVDGLDLSLVNNDASNFVTGYVSTDVNGDNIVDALDLQITNNNALNFVSKITP